MGFFFFAAWAGSVIVLGSPAVALAIVLAKGAKGRRWFLPVAAAAALLALSARMAWLWDAQVTDGGVPVWPTMFALILHVPLLVSLPLAGAGLLGLRLPPSRARQMVTGLGAGVAASIPLQLLLPSVLGRLAGLLGLRLIY
jgi:hypothetical protein